MSSSQLTNETQVTLQKLAAYKDIINADIDEYSAKLSEGWEQEYSLYSQEAINAFCSVLSRGGKRLRGALVMNAYQMMGGTDEVLARTAARIIEMVHAYALIIDDISDRSDIRRGGPTAHRMLESYHKERHLTGDPAHFGISVAMQSAVAGLHVALLDLGKLPASDTVKLLAMNNVNECLVTTLNGQFNDIFHEMLHGASEDAVKQVLTWKTAYYTFLNPLTFGAILAEADPAEYECLREYSINIGLSFQIVDDILGMFGDEAISGKSAQDDLKQGKITLLIARALSHASPMQKNILLAALGNQQLTHDEYHACRQIIEETGALDYARQLANQYSARAVAALDQAPSSWQPDGIAFLRGLAAYIINRSS